MKLYFQFVSMENFEETVCSLCFNVVSDRNSKVIEETTGEVLDVLLLKLSAEDKLKPAICKNCSVKLFAAFKFKVTCKYNEDRIVSYIGCGNTPPVDLGEVYSKKRGKKRVRSMSKNERICRLCMEIVTREFTSVNEVEDDVLLRYIPELNFSSTKEPVICSVCFDSLNIHSSFLKDCLDIQKKVRSDYRGEIPANTFYIKTENIEIKSEENDEDSSLHFNDEEHVEVKTEDEGDINYWSKPEESLSAEKYKCGMCDYESKNKHYLKHHELKHKDFSEVQIYICAVCSYKTKRKNNLIQHLLTHKEPSKVQMYKCDACNFKTKHLKSHLFHQLRHKDVSEVQMYTCDVCNFKAKRKDNLISHQLKHKDTSEVQMYKCSICNFETKYKNRVKLHQVVHKDFSEAQLYECDKCGHRTKHKHNLIQHLLRHKSDSVA